MILNKSRYIRCVCMTFLLFVIFFVSCMKPVSNQGEETLTEENLMNESVDSAQLEQNSEAKDRSGDNQDSNFINRRDEMDELNVIKLQQDKQYQTIEGFGASGAWWAQNVGGWDTASDIMDLLYDKEKGVGLTIFRYNIGAGEPNKARDQWRHAKSLRNAEGEYDLNRDKNALTIFKMAAERGAENNVLFANSPPASMTVSGFTSGGLEEKQSNLKPESEKEFVSYLADITNLLLGAGYPVKYVSPINEPQWGWGGSSASQEGCYYEPDQIVRVGRALALELKERELPVKISLVDSGTWYDEKYTLTMYKRLMDDEVLREAMDHYAVHSYWSDEKAKKKTALYFSDIDDMLPLHQSEWCQMEHGRDMGMDGALTLAKEVHMDMTILSVVSWSHWLAVSMYDYNDGLVYADEQSHKFKAAKRLWTLGNYSRFLHEGYVRIEATLENKDVLVSAYQSPDGKETVVVAINPEDMEQEIGVELFNQGKTQVFVTDAENDSLNCLETLEDVWKYKLPAKSVVTFVNQS